MKKTEEFFEALLMSTFSHMHGVRTITKTGRNINAGGRIGENDVDKKYSGLRATPVRGD